eukprot:3860629-Pleurochrysis_carterae.AAC.3
MSDSVRADCNEGGSVKQSEHLGASEGRRAMAPLSEQPSSLQQYKANLRREAQLHPRSSVEHPGLAERQVPSISKIAMKKSAHSAGGRLNVPILCSGHFSTAALFSLSQFRAALRVLYAAAARLPSLCFADAQIRHDVQIVGILLGAIVCAQAVSRSFPRMRSVLRARLLPLLSPKFAVRAHLLQHVLAPLSSSGGAAVASTDAPGTQVHVELLGMPSASRQAPGETFRSAGAAEVYAGDRTPGAPRGRRTALVCCGRVPADGVRRHRL